MRYGQVWSGALFLKLSALIGCGSSAEETCYMFSAAAEMNALTSVNGSTDVQRYHGTRHLAGGRGSSAVRATSVPPS